MSRRFAIGPLALVAAALCASRMTFFSFVANIGLAVPMF
jgi:hypothetical protein